MQTLKFAPSDPKEKRDVLRQLLRESGEVKNAIIFCNRKRDVGILLKSLQKHGFNAGALHGDMEQRERTATLEAFRRGEITYLAASDVAARGLDIPEVSHVYNFDVPISPEDYVHRIGRTGRAGREGFAATLVTGGDMEAVRAIEKLCGEKIVWAGGEPSSEAIEEGRRAGGGRRGRPRRGGAAAAGREDSPRGRGRGGEPRASKPAEPRAPRSAEHRASKTVEARVSQSEQPSVPQAAAKPQDPRPSDARRTNARCTWRLGCWRRRLG